MGGDRLRARKELLVTKARSLQWLYYLFATQQNYWDDYLIGVAKAEPSDASAISENLKKIASQNDALMKRQQSILSALVLRLARSPDAIEWDNRVHKLEESLQTRLHQIGLAPKGHVTKEQLDAVDEEVNRIVEEAKTFPQLSAEEVQNELDAFSEKRILRNTGTVAAP